MTSPQDIFDFFKENDSKVQESPPRYIWDKLEQKLEVHTSFKKKRKRKILFLQMGIAASILVSLSIIGFIGVWATKKSENKIAANTDAAPPKVSTEISSSTQQVTTSSQDLNLEKNNIETKSGIANINRSKDLQSDNLKSKKEEIATTLPATQGYDYKENNSARSDEYTGKTSASQNKDKQSDAVVSDNPVPHEPAGKAAPIESAKKPSPFISSNDVLLLNGTWLSGGAINENWEINSQKILTRNIIDNSIQVPVAVENGATNSQRVQYKYSGYKKNAFNFINTNQPNDTLKVEKLSDDKIKIIENNPSTNINQNRANNSSSNSQVLKRGNGQ